MASWDARRRCDPRQCLLRAWSFPCTVLTMSTLHSRATDVVQEVRQFSRFYTRLIGLLDEQLPDTDLSLLEGRVIYELATCGPQTAADITRTLEVDKAQLSRTIRALKARRLLSHKPDPAHARKRMPCRSGPVRSPGRVIRSTSRRWPRISVSPVLSPTASTPRRIATLPPRSCTRPH